MVGNQVEMVDCGRRKIEGGRGRREGMGCGSSGHITMIGMMFVVFAVVLKLPTTEAQLTYACTSFANWQSYWSSWFQQYPSYAYVNMYPFGSTFCDTNTTSATFNPNTTFDIPFYGTTYRSIWVSSNGYILFNESLSSQTPPSMNYIPDWPNQDFPLYGAIDPPFVAIFYASIQYMTGTPQFSTISYRVLNPQAQASGSTQQSIQVGMLAQISQDVRAATLGTMWFAAQYGVVVTYYNVTMSGGSSCTTGNTGTCLRNTFQIAMVTDGQKSFTVFNYFNITWVGGTNYQYCDPNTGQNSTNYPNCQPAQIGFNAGGARGFTSLPYGGTSQVINMDTLSGTNVTGRWIYQISGDVIHHGGCTNDTTLAASGNWPLTITPLFGPMFGGNVVNVSGPCFLPGATVLCRFGTIVALAYNWGDIMQVMCVQPVLYEVGPITLSVSIDGGANYYYSTTYTVVQQERLVPIMGVSVVNSNNDWLNPNTMTLTWKSANLSSEWGNAVTIQLLGYYEQTWMVIYTFAYQQANTGTFTFTYFDQMCYSQNNNQICSKYNLGAFRVSLSNWQWDPKNPVSMWSAMVPLGWFMKDQVAWNQGSDWAHTTCNNWFSLDSQSTTWSNYLPSCPCTLNQTYVDFGRFAETTDCNLYNSALPGGCPRNQGALACYQSYYMTSYGSSTRCCFDQYGNLMYTGDSVNGGISDRSSPWGMYPYQSSPYIPSISNWQNDLLPYYYCCIWQSNAYDCFNLYMNARQTQDCNNYSPPGHATAFGDPHFVTMDGTLFTFNAWGEFWLLMVDNVQVAGTPVSFSLQARFQQPFNQTWGQTMATVMTAVAMQLNNGTIITIMTNLFSLQERMLVYVNSTLLNFTGESAYWQQYPNFVIKSNDITGTYSNFTVIFDIGIGINVGWQNGVMQMYAAIPPQFMRMTGGLFGSWNGLVNQDLIPRASTNYISPTDQQSVFQFFGMTWLVLPGETIFTYAYRAQLNYNYYYNPWFIPCFTLPPPNTTITSGQVSSLCLTDTSCAYDYYVMQNATIAADTHQVTMWDAQLRSMGGTVTSCGWLNVPDAVKQQPISYLAGSSVNILYCMNGFQQWGSQTSYTCQSTGYNTAQWTPVISIQCQWLNGQLPSWEQAAISVPICVGVTVLTVIAIFCLVRFHRRRRAKREQRREKRHGADSIPSSTTNLVPDSQTRLPAQNTSAPVPAYSTIQQSNNNDNGRPTSSYNHIVTGTLSDSYLERHSQTSTTSKMSAHTGVTTNSNGRPPLPPPMVLSPNNLPPPPPMSYRTGTPTQAMPLPGSRPITPSASINGSRGTVTYTQDPGARGGTPGFMIGGSARASPAPYSYQTSQNIDVNNRAGDYYNRRYAGGAGGGGGRYPDTDSEV